MRRPSSRIATQRSGEKTAGYVVRRGLKRAPTTHVDRRHHSAGPTTRPTGRGVQAALASTNPRVSSADRMAAREACTTVTAAHPTGSFAVDVELYVAHSLRVCALPKRMLRVLHHHNMLTVSVSIALTKASTTPLPCPVNATSLWGPV